MFTLYLHVLWVCELVYMLGTYYEQAWNHACRGPPAANRAGKISDKGSFSIALMHNIMNIHVYNAITESNLWRWGVFGGRPLHLHPGVASSRYVVSSNYSAVWREIHRCCIHRVVPRRHHVLLVDFFFAFEYYEFADRINCVHDSSRWLSKALALLSIGCSGCTLSCFWSMYSSFG